MKTVTLKVQKIVRHADGVHLTFKDVYVEVPELYTTNALKEKKSWGTLDKYAFAFKYGYLKEHYALCRYIESKVGRIDWQNIEKINIKKFHDTY